jgi:hypothetical protein
MSGTGMLGLIVLNSRVNADPSQSGNILINPSVTNIKAFALTERSVLAYSSNTGVFDGFNEDYTQNSKQLYWKGSIASQNTRYATDFKNDQGELAPYLPKESDIWLPQECANHQNFQSSCSSSGSPSDQQKAAQRFDLAKLRKFRGGAENQALDLKEDLEKYSIIIEYNSRLNEQNAPPLFIVPKSIN